MKVLCEYHHTDLWQSLILLFEARLGWELYKPISEEWATEGYWTIAQVYGNDPATIKQYLTTEVAEDMGDHWRQWDMPHQVYHKFVTLEQFSDMKFDLVISSIAEHDETFERLIKERMPNAKHISHMGNPDQKTELPNVLSTTGFVQETAKNYVIVHQEFSLETYQPRYNLSDNNIRSFIHTMPEPERFEAYKSGLPEFNFESYGSGNLDGTPNTPGDIARLMNSSKFGYHVKPAGDGMGFVIHHWAAVGVPILTVIDHYKGFTAEPLLEDKVTCIDLGVRTVEENIALIQEMSQLDNYANMCYNVRSRFKEVVNFDAEEIEIRRFLERVFA